MNGCGNNNIGNDFETGQYHLLRYTNFDIKYLSKITMSTPNKLRIDMKAFPVTFILQLQ